MGVDQNRCLHKHCVRVITALIGTAFSKRLLITLSQSNTAYSMPHSTTYYCYSNSFVLIVFTFSKLHTENENVIGDTKFMHTPFVLV